MEQQGPKTGRTPEQSVELRETVSQVIAKDEDSPATNNSHEKAVAGDSVSVVNIFGPSPGAGLLDSFRTLAAQTERTSSSSARPSSVSRPGDQPLSSALKI